jgi:glucose/arabinose dehydrogenase
MLLFGTPRRAALSAGVSAALALCALSAHALQGRVVATGLNQPVFVAAPVGDQRVFVVEKAGLIRVSGAGGSLSTFLDITSLVQTEGERGLLGLAFDPQYARNGRFYVNYIDRNTLETVVARFTVSPPDANQADPSTRQDILRITQEDFSNHKAGWIGFRPGNKRNLYIATGDGGSGYDPNNNAQDGGSLLGKMLRIDVSASGAGYTIPADNPFATSASVRPEIWALGLRNPFRPSFDRDTGDFWIADVGQDTREEINFEPAADAGGNNYGWRLREGTIRTPLVGGNKPGLTGPVYDYPHLGSTGSLGNSVTGGYVYRGPSIPEADGRYFFGDFVSNTVYSFAYGADGKPTKGRDETAALLGGTGLQGIASFGEDGQGRLYAIGNINGVIVAFCPGTPSAPVKEAQGPCK